MDYMLILLLHGFFATVWVLSLAGLAFVFWAHNKSGARVYEELERAIIYYVQVPSLILLVLLGAHLTAVNSGVLRSDWFYLKMFVFALLIGFYAHFVVVHKQRNIERLGYGNRFFAVYSSLVLICFFVISALLMYRPE